MFWWWEMYKTYLALSLSLIMISLTLSLINVAEDMSHKTIKYAENINNKMDCAFLGIPLNQCNNLTLNNDFKDDLIQYKEKLMNYKEELEKKE